jgi:ABC-type antimicrobial peptide transport system permease subunit
MAYAVGRRRRELSVRLALGASPRQLVAGVLARGLVLGGAGLGLGMVIALAAGPAAAGFLYGVSPRDPVALAGASAVLLVAALAATWLPARRAARIDPAVTLRSD